VASHEPLLLGVDLGTSSAKAVVIDAEGVVHGQASAGYPVQTPHPGWAESAPADWWRAAGTAVREAVGSRAAGVVSIGVVGQMHGVVLADAAGEALRPAILWADLRSEGELERWRELDEPTLDRLANPVVAGMAGPSLLWLRDHEPETYSAARWALQPKDWLRLRLTGTAASEPSDASATLLYDVPADDWAWSLIDRLGLRSELLAPLAPSGQSAGTLSAAAAGHMGLPAGLPVAVGAGDTAAAALGTGLLEPGPIQLTIGTGGQVVAPRAEPVGDPHRRIHLYRAAVPGRWYAMAATLNAGLALEWVRGVLGVDWDSVYEEAFAAPPGAAGVRFLPYLSGERTPHLDAGARGAWLGLDIGHRRSHLLRAALEGVAFSIRDCLAALEAAGAGPDHDELRLAGGGSLHPAWRQLLADVLRRPLAAVETPDASARGAALLAGVAAGVFRDAHATLAMAPRQQRVATPSEASDVYDSAYAAFREGYRQLRPGP
jgi:xylulokinase